MSGNCKTPDIILKPGGNSLYNQVAPGCAAEDNIVLKNNDGAEGGIPISECVPSGTIVLEDNDSTSGVLVTENCSGITEDIINQPWDTDVDFALLKEDGSYLLTVEGDYLLAYET